MKIKKKERRKDESRIFNKWKEKRKIEKIKEKERKLDNDKFMKKRK